MAHVNAHDLHEDPSPGSGRRAPRADFLSDAPRLSLNGTWRFRLSPTAAGSDAPLSDPGWGTIRVPSHWVLEGYDRPLYTNTAYPFPIDPPYLPDDNPTGDYRLVFDLPSGWPPGRSVLRFQGVDSCGTAWLNGHLLGHSKGSRLPFEFDVTGIVRPRGNVLAVRVQRWSSGSYLEDQDMWWLPGIFRDVELLSRPVGGIDDFTVVASFSGGTGRLLVTSSSPGLVEIPLLGLAVPTGQEVTIPHVEPWSAERPHLYHGTLSAAGETISLAIGFRTVAVSGGRLLVNGAPVFLRGVNRHEHDPTRGRALDRDTMIRDIVLMKRHNINAVRTAHYPPHPEFLRLCDEYGLWVVEECDIETHGFIYAGWEGNPPDEPMWREALLDRTRRMVERDKNHPSVIIWSLANESMGGSAFAEIESWIRARDPGRPLHYERDPTYRHSDFYSLMYPSLDDLARIGTRTEPAPDGISPSDDSRRRGLPFLLCEYAHAMGNGPGSLQDFQEILESSERFCGAFVWEWIDHGLTGVDASGHTYFRHGGDIDAQPNGGTYCLDGLLFPDRTPSPGLASLAAALAPVGIAFGDDHLTIINKYDISGLDHLAFRWRVEVDGIPTSSGDLPAPPCPPHETIHIPLPAPAIGPAAAPRIPERQGEAWLTVEAVLAADTPWASAGHVVAFAQTQLAPRTRHQRASEPPETASASGRPADAPSTGGDVLRLGEATFDPRTGRLVRVGDVEVDGPVLDVWRAPTENDRGQGDRNALAADWDAVGLDRFVHRTSSVHRPDPDTLVVCGRSGPATRTLGFRTTYTWQWRAEVLRLTVTADPVGDWEDTAYGHLRVNPPRMGARFRLPGGYRDVTWFGRGPGESYADSLGGTRIGRFAAAIDDLQTPYVVPQENGNHMGTRWLELSGPGLATVRVDAEPYVDFTARRWTSEALRAARHVHELCDSGHVWLNLDHGQQGIGSASCGPALPERYRLAVRSFSWSMTWKVCA
ncbi:DUF4981 domain-containing protein [Nonomuraea sp. NBC_00507]|uniref:glycoside hydrolase family 2 TIM barrel-domain containing protein n=1 Tax=Nonomuraea sp. NBC_00507 TaxID=2976002 RepID=UPI002E1715AB